MELFKASGCPNCKSDKSSLVWNADDFRQYKSLDLVGSYGSCTDLFRCNECRTQYIRVNKGHLYHLLTSATEKLLLDFFNQNNFLSNKHIETVNRIGSPKSIAEFPARVKTKDGHLLPYAVIRKISSIWPISLDLSSVRLISEIDEILPSDEAMTLDQRSAAFSALEIQMGVAPIWLRRNSSVYMTNHGQYFIPTKYGAPDEFSIETGIDRPMPRFDSVPITYFIGPT